MELMLPTLSLLVTLFVFMSMVVNKAKSQNPNPKLPPSPWKLPFIGHMHHLLHALPHRALRDLANKHGPILHLWLGQVPTVVVSSPKLAKELLKTNDVTFAQRPVILAAEVIAYGCTDVVFAPYGDYWRQVRKICILELLSAKRVQSFRSVREQEVSDLIRSISLTPNSPVNLSEKFLSLANNITSRTAFGKKCDQQIGFLPAMKAAVESGGGLDLVDIFPSLKLLHLITGMKFKLQRIHRKLDRILNDVIKEHIEKRTATTKVGSDEDLVDVLLRIQEHSDLEFPLTIDNIKAVILDMFIAGSETSTTTMTWAMTELVRNPRVMAKAQAEVRQGLGGKEKISESDTHELNYMKLVIKETLRLHPPASLLVPRECREECEIGGYMIPAKTRAVVNAWAMGRNPQYWDDAESFMPERFDGSSIDFKGLNFKYIPFGAGRRICPGMLFGLANMELALAEILFYFDWKSAGDTRDLDTSEMFGATVRKRYDLRLFAIPRMPLRLD